MFSPALSCKLRLESQRRCFLQQESRRLPGRGGARAEFQRADGEQSTEKGDSVAAWRSSVCKGLEVEEEKVR